MPPNLRHDVPDDSEPAWPTLTPDRRPRDPSLQPRAWKPNRADPDDHPVAMNVGGWLEAISAVAALLTVLVALGSLSARKEPEGMASFAIAFFSLPLAVVTILMLAATSLLYVWCGASRRARIVGILSALATAASCAWLVNLA